MPNAIFPCPFCGRRMGVGQELLGRHVRCPHCKQVIQAPHSAGGNPAPSSAKLLPPNPSSTAIPSVVSPPPTVQPPVVSRPKPADLPPERELPTFSVPREAHDSIFGEAGESEDEVFASSPSQAGRMPSPSLPELSALLPPRPAPQNVSDPMSDLPPARSPGQGVPPGFDNHQELFEMMARLAPPVLPSPSREKPALPNGPGTPGETAPVPPANPASLVDFSSLPKSLPQPTLQAPPQVAKGTASAVWPSPPRPAPAPVWDDPMPPLPQTPNQAPEPVNPWASYDLSGGAPPLHIAAPKPAPVPPAPEPAFTPVPQEAAAAPVPLPEPEPFSSPVAFENESAVPPRFRPAETPPKRKAGGSPILTMLLVLYGLLMTGAAVYAFFFHKPGMENTAPTDLGSIPDMIGEYPPADRKKVSNLRIPLDGELPASAKVSLMNSLRVGQLEVTPLAVEKKPLVLYQKLGKSNKFEPIKRPLSGLVLRLKLKNTSEDVSFCPVDPAFNRRDLNVKKAEQPLPGTGLVFGTQSFWGGPSKWPLTAADGIAAEYYKGQEADAKPLVPGESRDYVIIASRDAKLLPALDKHAGPVLWRVQLRRGLETVAGKDVSMTAIVGVEFESKEIAGKS